MNGRLFAGRQSCYDELKSRRCAIWLVHQFGDERAGESNPLAPDLKRRPLFSDRRSRPCRWPYGWPDSDGKYRSNSAITIPRCDVVESSYPSKSFPTTLWTVVLHAGRDETAKDRAALRSFARPTGILFIPSCDAGDIRPTRQKTSRRRFSPSFWRNAGSTASIPSWGDFARSCSLPCRISWRTTGPELMPANGAGGRRSCRSTRKPRSRVFNSNRPTMRRPSGISSVNGP